MALNYVALTVDVYDGNGNHPSDGTATFTPTTTLTDTTDHEYIGQIPVVVSFRPQGLPVVSLLATDNAAVTPSGWAWTVVFAGFTGFPASFNFFLPYSSGAAQYLSGQAPLPAGATSLLTESAQQLLAEG